MTARRVRTSVAVAALGVAGVILFWSSRSQPAAASLAPNVTASDASPQIDSNKAGDSSREARSIVPARKDLEGQPALAAPNPAELVTESPPLMALLGAPTTNPEAEAGIVLEVLNVYRRLFGAYPAGEDNRQFVNALLGANKENLPFIPRNHPRLNASGEIVDAWGTPFFFHLNSRISVEVRSAGADRRLYTADDIVAGKFPSIHGQIDLPDDEPRTN
jgi:hypothetical protein